ncbi:hypothetical protein D3C72_2275530 [compost metagenome]
MGLQRRRGDVDALAGLDVAAALARDAVHQDAPLLDPVTDLQAIGVGKLARDEGFERLGGDVRGYDEFSTLARHG